MEWEKTPITIRYATQDDIAAVDRFNPIGEIAWHHEFFSSEKPGSPLAVAVANDAIIGSEGFVSYPVIWKGETRLSHRSERTLLDPVFRGRGIFNGLIALCADEAIRLGSLFCWGSTGAVKAFKAAGFKHFHGHRTYVLVPIHSWKVFTPRFWKQGRVPFNPVRLWKRVRSRELVLIWELLGVAACLLRPFTRRLAGGDSRSLQHESSPRIESDIDDLHERIRQSGSLVYLQHSKALYRWKEEQVAGRFVTVCSYDGPVLRAYLYAHVVAGRNVANIVDFCADSGDSLRGALAHLQYVLRSTPVASLLFIINKANPEQAEIMRSMKPYAAFQAGEGGSFVVKPLDLADPEFYRDLRDWYLTDLWLQL